MMASKFQVPSLEHCKEIFKATGECKHYHKEWVTPVGCHLQIKTCMVCAKNFERRYFTQAQTIEMEIDKLLNNGETDKQKIYTDVVNRLSVPRPTVRRVARDFKAKMLNKVAVLDQVGKA